MTKVIHFLGVEISADLKWSKHIANITKKASAKIGFLRRNLGRCPATIRRMAYISLVRSTLDYGSTVWDPFQTGDIAKLERIQRQAVRFIKRDYTSRQPGCVTEMLREYQLPPLQERRKQQRLTTLYKIAEGHIPALSAKNYLTPFNANKRKIKAKTFPGFQTTNIVQKYTYNNSRGYIVPDSNTEQYHSSFFVKTIAEWNELAEEVVTASSVAAFAAALGRGATQAPLQ